jgi:hypothetical protein
MRLSEVLDLVCYMQYIKFLIVKIEVMKLFCSFGWKWEKAESTKQKAKSFGLSAFSL